ncbi:MAG: substrate-binding domain-containing protein [Hyphomicrobium sp.]|mgnify:CR=1 FL=1|nr:substrate-binding domain-containing protein [Hyphomicrobium sp.]
MARSPLSLIAPTALQAPQTWLWRLITVAGMVAALAFAPSYAGDEARTLSIQGSTTFHSRVLQPNLADIERESGIKLNVVPNKSIWGLIALMEKRAELAMMSADLTGEVDQAKLTAPALSFDNLQQFEIARVAVAFITHPSNPVSALSHQQLKDIITGTTTNWKDVGGPDLPIRVVATQNGGGTIMALRAQLLGGGEITAPGAARLESARHVVNAVEQLPGALGIAQTGLAASGKVAIIESGAPIEQLLTYVSNGEPTPAAKAVIDATRKALARRPL